MSGTLQWRCLRRVVTIHTEERESRAGRRRSMRQSIGIAAIVTSLLGLAVIEVIVGFNSRAVVETVPISHAEGVRQGNASACGGQTSEPAGARQGRRRSVMSQG